MSFSSIKPVIMKNLLLFIFISATIFQLTSCSAFVEQDITQQNNVSDVITQGEWKVNQYINNNSDETSVFAGYAFTFNSNGTLIAKNNGVEVSGRWFEDKLSKQVIIQFVNNNDLEKISESWVVNSKQLSLVNLTLNDTPGKLLKIAKN
jgi:hypothetical protein